MPAPIVDVEVVRRGFWRLSPRISLDRFRHRRVLLYLVSVLVPFASPNVQRLNEQPVSR
jgi:hypothetical protein